MKKPCAITLIQKLIRTHEDWYPTINQTVRASLIRLSTCEWRVCVWGGDDFGLEKDFPSVDRQAAKKLYKKLVDFTSQADMKRYGMYNA